HNVGGVGCLRRVKNAIGVARKVLEHTQHSLLVGDLATDFAERMGFKVESLSAKESDEVYRKWKQRSCQPNYWENVSPDPKTTCGPYSPLNGFPGLRPKTDRDNHDTIGMIAMDKDGKLA